MNKLFYMKTCNIIFTYIKYLLLNFMKGHFDTKHVYICAEKLREIKLTFYLKL